MFSVIDATTGERLEINRKANVLIQPSSSRLEPIELYIPSKCNLISFFNTDFLLRGELIPGRVTCALKILLEALVLTCLGNLS